MSEENKFGPKNNWTRIFKKKWFFPSLYLTLAALLISTVVWYQNTGTEQAEIVDDTEEVNQEDAVPVSSEGEQAEEIPEDAEETVQMPIENSGDAVIITTFFDYDEEATSLANALIHYNNRYYQSTGVAIGQADEESFDVVAALSGTVAEVKEDPLMGHVVVLEHDEEVTTYYASLGDVVVAEGDEIAQGDRLGAAANNIFGKENGTHVHFEMEKSNVKLNPEQLFDAPLSSIEVPKEADEPQEEAGESVDGEYEEEDAPEDVPTSEEEEDAEENSQPEGIEE